MHLVQNVKILYYDRFELTFICRPPNDYNKNKRSAARVCVTSEYKLRVFRGYVAVALFKLYQHNVKYYMIRIIYIYTYNV